MDLAIKFEIPSASNSTEVSSLSRSSTPTILQFVFGVLGNLIAIIVFITARKNQKMETVLQTSFRYNLSGGLGILLIFPTIFLRFAPNFMFDFRICAYNFFMFIFILTSSAMIVCAMSFDRFMAILYLYRYIGIVKNNQAQWYGLPVLSFQVYHWWAYYQVCFMKLVQFVF